MLKNKTEFFRENEPIDILAIHEWLFEQFITECDNNGIDLDDKTTYPNGCKVSLSLSVSKIGKRKSK